MNKKLLTFIFGMILLISILSSASGYFLPTKDYNQETETIKIDNAFGLFGKVAEYNLTYNTEQCLINCYAEGTAILHEYGKLFSELNFENRKGNEINIKNNKIFILVNESYEEEIIDYEEKCSTSINGTEYCIDEEKGKHKEINYKEVWKEYNFENLEKGNYKWRIEGTKRIGESVDWIASAFGTELKEWAWWNDSWISKRIINISTATSYTGINYSLRLNITYDADMNSDFSDLRFLNSTEDGELGYWINSSGTVSSNYADVYVLIPENITTSNQSIYMYYKNSDATTTSNCSNAFLFCDFGDTNQTSQWTSSSAPTGGVGIGGNAPALTWSLANKEYTITQIVNKIGWIIAPINFSLGDEKIEINVLMKNEGANNPQPGVGIRKDTTNATGSQYGQAHSFSIYSFTTTRKDIGTGNGSTTTTNTYQSNRIIAQFDTNFMNASLTPTNNYYSNSASFTLQYGNPAIVFYQNGGTNAMQFKEFIVKRYSDTIPNYYIGEEETIGVIVALNYPIAFYNSTSQTINFNATITPDAINITNQTFSIGSIINTTNITGIESIVFNWTEVLSDGNYSWNVTSCGKKISDDTLFCTTSTNRNLSIESTKPQIDILVGNGTFNYGILTTNHTINYTITDTHLDSCWLNYNGTNTTIPCTSGAINTTNFTLQYNVYNATIYANDTYGNLNSSFFNWDYNLLDLNNYTYSTTATESSSSTFVGYFQTGSSLTSSSLQYNNTNYSTSISSLGDNSYMLSSTIITPSVSVDTNISWFFWVNGINATSFNQTVQSVNLDNCSSYTYPIILYNLRDENTQILINNSNSSIETTIILKTISGENVAEISKTFNGNSTPSICSEINLSSSGLRMWEQSRYGLTDYAYEQHNIQNLSMNGDLINITLYDLSLDLANIFRITYKSITFLPVKDAILEIQRKYLGEGVFKEVESPITDSNGEASASFDLNAVLYRIIVKQNGSILSTFENPAIACENLASGICNINLNERQSVSLIDNYDTINDFSYGLTQDNRTITLTFSIPSGTARTINMFINQSTILGNQTSCNQSLFASSGQLQCVINESLGDVFTSIYVSSNGDLITTGSTTIIEDRSQYFGTDNIVMTFFFVLSLVLLMISDPIAVLFGIVFGLLGSSLMLFLNSGSLFGTASILTYLILVVVVLIVKITIRRDKGA